MLEQVHLSWWHSKKTKCGCEEFFCCFFFAKCSIVLESIGKTKIYFCCIIGKYEDVKELGLGLCTAVEIKGADDAPLVVLFLPEVMGKTNIILEFE